MPSSRNSIESHLSQLDSLPSLSDHESISSASTHSSLSSDPARRPNPLHTHQFAPYHLRTDMQDSTRASGPQRSSTIKALNQPAASSGIRANSSSIPAYAPKQGAMASLDALTAPQVTLVSTASPPVLHALVFPPSSSRGALSGKLVTSASASSDARASEAYPAFEEAAPRLSMSSTGSGSTSELATPENLHQAWPYDDDDSEQDSALAALQASSTASAPRDAKNVPMGIGSLHSQPYTAEVDLRPPSRSINAATNQLDRLALQRPAKLERLSSGATTATAKASTHSDESPQTATQSPRGFQAHDLSSLRTSSALETSASAPGISQSSSVDTSPVLNTDVPRCASMTSPDSWRSLLPEHDPYFASDDHLRASQIRHSTSPQSLRPYSGLVDIDPYVLAKTSPRATAGDCASISSFDTSRTSFSSSVSGYSTMSMIGPGKSSMQSQDSARSDSWRSLLPDDDRFHSSRREDTNGAARTFGASSSLASPSLSDHLESSVSSEGPRSAFSALHNRPNRALTEAEQESAARRHSSFSSVEPNNSSQYTATRAMLASMRDAVRSSGSSASASRSFVDTGFTSPGNDSLLAPSMTPALSNSTEDDLSERDSWPTSRGGGRHGPRSSSPVSSGPLTPETGQTPQSRPSLGAALGQQHRGLARVDSPSFVSETSDSVVRTTPRGSVATTTTTITKTTTSTTTRLLDAGLFKARSEAGADDAYCAGRDVGEDDQLGEDGRPIGSQAMKSCASSCSVTAPISPPSLPFLDRRPAPPETELVIETERHQYVLVTRLPGFSLECITLATKKHSTHRTLHIVADKWDAEGGGHFERRVTFPDKECDLVNVKAEFDGNILRVHVPRNRAGTKVSSASSATF